MAKLTTAKNRIEERLCITGEAQVSVPNAVSARNAKARASQAENAGKLSAAEKKKVDSKADKVLKKK